MIKGKTEWTTGSSIPEKEKELWAVIWYPGGWSVCVNLTLSSISHYEAIAVIFYVNILLVCHNSSSIKSVFTFVQKYIMS